MLNADKVTAVLVTRGDVNMQPILDSLPYGKVIVWDNSKRDRDEKVWGRYAALDEVTTPVVYFQDDDCIVTCHDELLAAYEPGLLVGNAFDDPARLAKYHDTTLLGWGSIFDVGMPWAAFSRYGLYHALDEDFRYGLGAEITFPMLSRTRTITAGVEWLTEDGDEVFRRENRMWLQPDFYAKLDYWLARARSIRDSHATWR